MKRYDVNYKKKSNVINNFHNLWEQMFHFRLLNVDKVPNNDNDGQESQAKSKMKCKRGSRIQKKESFINHNAPGEFCCNYVQLFVSNRLSCLINTKPL